MSSGCPGYASPSSPQLLLQPFCPVFSPPVLPLQGCKVLPPPEALLSLNIALQFHHLGCVLLEHQAQLPLVLSLQQAPFWTHKRIVSDIALQLHNKDCVALVH